LTVAAIEVANLTKRFGPVSAVHDLSFSVEPGTVVGFLGPNGAGKTTTLRILLGLVEPTAGTATFAGRRYRELSNPLRHVGAVLDGSNAHPGRTARNHLRLQAAAAGVPPTRVDEVLERVDLTPAADRHTRGFSLGMRQRLGLATALLAEPEILILDEPANGLDPEGVRWLRDLIRQSAADGHTVLVSSHILAEMAQTVDHVVILNRGRLVTQSRLEDLTAGQGPVVRIRSPQAADLRHLLTADGATATAVGPDRIEVSGSTAERIAMIAAKHAIPIVESTTETANLEDVFFSLTGTPNGKDAAR
jgi:ABC-2 type transport system ATP-binding protein